MKKEEAWKYTKYKDCIKKMSKRLAQKIKKLRVKNGETWRGVAHEITNGETDNQLLGMDLCFVAMKFFKESEGDGWN